MTTPVHVHVLTKKEQDILDKLSNVIYDQIVYSLELSESRGDELVRVAIRAIEQWLEQGN